MRRHPFVGTSVRAYTMDFRRRGASLDSATKLGVNLGGGVEYFSNRTLTFNGEARYKAVQNFGRVDPSGLTLARD